MSAVGYQELDDTASAGLTRFFNRTGWEPVHWDKSLAEAVNEEDDGEDSSTVGTYEIHQRMTGVRAFLRYITSRGVHPFDMLTHLADACRAMHVEPFQAMTMGEQAMLFAQSRAAVSFRGKLLSKEIELAGMRGSKLPGQKSKESSESYRALRTGKRKEKRRTVQKSFLRRLKVSAGKTRKAEGGSRNGKHAPVSVQGSVAA